MVYSIPQVVNMFKLQRYSITEEILELETTIFFSIKWSLLTQNPKFFYLCLNSVAQYSGNQTYLSKQVLFFLSTLFLLVNLLSKSDPNPGKKAEAQHTCQLQSRVSWGFSMIFTVLYCFMAFQYAVDSETFPVAACIAASEVHVKKQKGPLHNIHRCLIL